MNPFRTAIPCLITLAALPALAQPVGPMPVLELARHLNLSPSQREQMHKLMDSRKADLENRHFACDQARTALHTAQADPDLTPAQLRALCVAAAQAQQEEVLAGHALLKEMVALLSPEQLQKYRKAQAELPLIREAMAGARGQRGPGGRPGPHQGQAGHQPPPPDRPEQQGKPGNPGPQGQPGQFPGPERD